MSRQLYAILDLMDAAISHKELPEIRPHSNDLYSHIVTNMIQTFTRNDFLEVSLNEQKFQALSLELSALQYQINPHFLSNTLQMIDFEILKHTKLPTTANEMIQDPVSYTHLDVYKRQHHDVHGTAAGLETIHRVGQLRVADGEQRPVGGAVETAL